MKENLSKHLNLIPGILFLIVAILNFYDRKTSTGITYLCLSIAFGSLDLSKKKAKNQK